MSKRSKMTRAPAFREGRYGQEKAVGKAKDVQEWGRHKVTQGNTRQYKAIPGKLAFGDSSPDMERKE